jgi:hypothetical protein
MNATACFGIHVDIIEFCRAAARARVQLVQRRGDTFLQLAR